MEKYTNTTLLLKDLNNCNRNAQAFLYTLFYKKTAYYAYLQVNSFAIAQDIADQAFELLLLKARNFNSLKAVQSFLYSAVFYIGRNEKRHTAIANAYEEKQLHDLLTDYDEDALDAMIRAEFVDRIAREIESLESAYQKNVIKLYFYEGLKTHEISRRLTISPQTVRNYKGQALRILANAFIKKGLLQPIAFYLVIRFL